MDFQKYDCYVRRVERRGGRHFCSVACNNNRPINPIRFWEKVDKNGPVSDYRPDLGRCWIWTGFVSESGYGVSQENRQSAASHRVAFKLVKGFLPSLPLDHLCRVRSCCNPDHLEPVTHKENILRGVGAGAMNAKKTHCPKGHPFDTENTIIIPENGGRRCRICRHETVLAAGRRYEQQKRRRRRTKASG